MVDTQRADTRVSRIFSQRRPDCLVIVVSLFAAVLWSAISGKDINWDQLNYHFYLPYSLLGDRLATDYMPANGQSYLNPLAYVPFYWMVTHHWHSMLIASILAAFHALNIVFAYFILKRVLPWDNAQARVVGILGIVLAFLSPLFLTEVGTTFADISTSVLVSAAVLCGLHSDRAKPWWSDRSLLAGACIGAASGLKLSNLLFGPGLGLLLIFMQTSTARRIRVVFLLGIGSALGLLLIQGYWGWQLWKTFGNPFYPNFNSYFPSAADFPPGSAHQRFLADNFLDAALLPFRMLELRSWIYVENVAPDLRFAVLVIVSTFGLTRLLPKYRSSDQPLMPPSAMAFRSLSAFFALSYVAWLQISGNGRYAITLFILCGPMLAAMAWVTIARKKIAILVLALTAGFQLVHLQGAELRWTTDKWSTSWYEVSVPERLKQEPYLYISVGGNSNSYISPFLAEGSAFTNPIGQISFDFDKPGGEPLRRLFAKHQRRTRAIAPMSSPDLDGDSLARWVESMDAVISRLGFAVDANDCETISATGPPREKANDADAGNVQWLRTCRLVARPFALSAERARITKIVEEIVNWCPKLFRPAYTVVERIPNGWMANYVSTDSTLLIRGEDITAQYAHTALDLPLGTVQQWEKGVQPRCSDFPDKPRKVNSF